MKSHFAIYRMFTDKVAELGFTCERTAWWKRRRGAVLQGIHLHKFSFTKSFRVHAAIHLADFDAPDGMSSYDGWYEEGDANVLWRTNPPVARRYSFDYTESSGSCADELFAFARDILIPWFDRWIGMERLSKDTHSPLTHDQKTSQPRLTMCSQRTAASRRCCN